MVTSISHSPAETFALGEKWGRSVQPGLVIALCGDLGAGKTQLVKGLAAGLGVRARIVSPTFALVNVYQDGRVPLYHLDLYRLDTPEQIVAAGLEQYFYSDGIAVIEWAERWFVNKPEAPTHPSEPELRVSPTMRMLRWVEIEVLDGTDRRIAYEDIGA